MPANSPSQRIVASNRRVVSALIAGLVIGSTLVAPASVRASYPGDEGLITLGCGDSLIGMQPDGSDRRTLIDGEAQMHAWSPGGTQIAFIRNAEFSSDLWLANADGSNLRRVRRLDNNGGMATWSPDGRYIAYDAFSHATLLQRIEVVDLDTGDVSVVVSRSADSRWRPEWPVWSPNGDELAFMFTLDTLRSGMRAVEPDGGNMRVLTSPPADNYDTAPEWSPTADVFVFGRHSFGMLPDSIYAVDAEGGEPIRLTDDSEEGLRAAYSPSGSQIAYLAHPPRTGHPDILSDADPVSLWMMNSDGSGKRMVAEEVGCGEIDWQPIPDFPLVDARFSGFEPAIRWAYEDGIASGCTAERFCHERAITRGQVAAFLARALDLPDATEDHFGDDEGTTHEDDINRLAEAGLAAGCAVNRFCPGNRLTRAEMASFLARALELPVPLEDHFTDDDGMTHEANTNRLAEAGLTSGCAPSRFCPTRPITRGESIALLYRGFAP